MDAFNECIEFKDVSFAYGDKVVLSNINLSLKRSEKYLIIGPSGGGKSTLLNYLESILTLLGTNPNRWEEPKGYQETGLFQYSSQY